VKPFLIVNPASGGGKTGKVFPELKSVIERRLGPIVCEFTQRPGHAVELARDAAAAGHELVVAVGGDGTLNEVAEGLVTCTKPAQLGLIGQGTGGDFRRTLGIEHRLDRYLDALTGARVRKLDMGLAQFGQEQRHFINILSAGMGGLVDRYIASSSKLLGPTLSYYAASLRALANIQLSTLRITYWQAGEEHVCELATYMLAVCNGAYFGSGMHIAPMAQPDDGLLDVVALGDRHKAAFLLNTGKIYSANHMLDAATVHLRCDRVRIEHLAHKAPRRGRVPYLLDVDGEALGELAVDITIKPAAIEMRA
jgi:diacylglycerol kinase (ATP)